MFLFNFQLRYLLALSLIFLSCSFEDSEIQYEQNLVVFASIVANLPVVDTVFISRSANLSEDISTGDLWIENADVRLIDDSSKAELRFHSLGKGKYFPVHKESSVEEIENYISYVIKPGRIYHLFVKHESDSVLASTTVPAEFSISSAELGSYDCPDGKELAVGSVNVNNLKNISLEDQFQLLQNPQSLINQYDIIVDTINYRIGDCFTKSFASYPMFGVDFNDDSYSTIQIISYSLEAEEIGMEPLLDLNNDGTIEEGEFSDRNRNGLRDSCYINLIYNEEKEKFFDNDSLSYNDLSSIWKGPLLRGSAKNDNWRFNSPYRNNPFLWNIEEAPTVIGWLYFDYYGYYLMSFNATSETYFNYFSGDPLGQNIYLLPNSNIEDGFGVFYSKVSTEFIIYVKKDDSY